MNLFEIGILIWLHYLLGHCPFISEQNGNVVSCTPREGGANANMRNCRGRVFPLPELGAVCLQISVRAYRLCPNKVTISK